MVVVVVVAVAGGADDVARGEFDGARSVEDGVGNGGGGGVKM